MKKYQTNAEKQKAYRKRLKSSDQCRSELRLLLNDDSILKLKRLAAYNNNTLAKELEWILTKREMKVLCVMGDEKKAIYRDAIIIKP